MLIILIHRVSSNKIQFICTSSSGGYGIKSPAPKVFVGGYAVFLAYSLFYGFDEVGDLIFHFFLVGKVVLNHADYF